MERTKRDRLSLTRNQIDVPLNFNPATESLAEAILAREGLPSAQTPEEPIPPDNYLLRLKRTGATTASHRRKNLPPS